MCNQGICVGDVRGGVLCSCPLSSRGIFCENNGTELPYSECEFRHRLNNHFAEVLKGTRSEHGGFDDDRLRTIFEVLSTEWLALVTCERGGQYSLTSELMNVQDESTVRHVCLDHRGEVEENCQTKVCSALTTTSGTLCQHGSKCVGNINLQICNCTGTGHHGALCEHDGEDDLTECELKHDLAQFMLDALGGNVQVGGNSPNEVKTLVSTLLQDIHRTILWQPDCTAGGSHGYRGCQFRVGDQSIDECYCLDEQLQRITSISGSFSGLPDCPLSGTGACSEFTSDPCGEHGTCKGDINAGDLCQCEADYSGMTCDVNEASTLTECQKRSELSNYLLSVLHGYKEAPRLLKTSTLLLLAAGGIEKLEVPTCTEGDAAYKFICTYQLDPVSLVECRCTNEDGTYKAGDEGGKSCPDLAKPGECPLSDGEMGITVQECRTDFECPDSQKCCSVGSGNQCRDPVYVATFRVTVTIDATWKSAYSNLHSSDMTSITSQTEDVFRTLVGYRSVALASSVSRKGKLEVVIDVTASADVTMEDMETGVSRLRAYQLNIGGSTRRVTEAVFTDHSVCGSMDCGTGVCVSTSLGPRCVCREGSSGDRCQHVMLACNCSEGQQCLRGSMDGALACSCYPENDATCKLPPWYCEGKADCSGTEKCVHRKECGQGSSCEVQSSCILADEVHECDDQPCQHGGLCVVPSRGSSPYECQCKAGFSGIHCETNVAICQVVPNNLCSDGCVGDAHMGVICKCPYGRGGLSCDQPAHSNCERQSAFFSDLRKAWHQELTVPGVTKTQLYNLALHLAQQVHASTLPLRNCTSDGNFARVQCALNLTDEEEACHCVSKEGFPRQSNVEVYPGFPECTAPYSPGQLGKALCGTSLGAACGNGGKCVGNLLNGTLCACPSSRAGLFCQLVKNNAPGWEAPRSLCELSREVWQMTRQATQSSDHTLLGPLQSLQSHLFHARTASPDVMIRASCGAYGEFEPVQCAYNLRTEKATHCYCISPKGVVLESRTSWPEQPTCEGASSCPSRACHQTCEHGLAQDVHGCTICQCRHPCDGQCDHDPSRRCLVELQQDCGRENWEGTCTSGVCRHRHKSGTCPVSVSANMTAVQTLKSHDITTCDVTCLDDADCPNDDKCCGVCGVSCVKPTGDLTCSTHRTSAEAELKLVVAVKEAMDKGLVRLEWANRLVRAKLESLRATTKVWVPECQDNGFYDLTQCYTKVGGVVGRDVDGCFCVDPQGNVIADTETDSKDKASCNAKPGNCPFLQPNSSASHGCGTDFDCQADLKCCSDGLGSLCVQPLKPKPGEAFSLDEVIASMCQYGRRECGINGRCVIKWFNEGRVCACNKGYSGPICTTTSNEPRGYTACQRRKDMADLLMDTPTLLSFFLQRARTLGATGIIKLTFPKCQRDGGFEAKQCTEDVDSRHEVDCFCVNRMGAPLGGTNVAPDQTPPCARLNPCSVGAPLHHVSNGSAVTCGTKGSGECVSGYTCQAGRFGDFFCCRDPTSNVNVCKLPPSPGNDCQYYEGRQQASQQRYYYHASSKTCKSIKYTGCADVKPNFDSKAACESRCVRKEHVGKCPAKTVVAERATCGDVCEGDADCLEEQKCCPTSCGRRCVLAHNTGKAVCELGQPLTNPLTQQLVQCTGNADCGVGYHCRSSRCCIKRTSNICEQKQLTGRCSGRHERYYYDADSKQCLPFTFTGCGANDNNFLTKYHCCNACGPKGRCKEGTCPVPRPVLSVSCDYSCLGDGDCPANQICCNSSCGGSACVIPKSPVEAKQSCRDDLIDYHRQMLHSKDGCFLRFRPRCDGAGNWEQEQCSDKLGICWCVTAKGHVVPKSRVRGVAQCQWVTPVTMDEADKKGRRENDRLGEECQVCPGGEDVQCCDEDLCLQVCAAHPEAVCRINPCGGCSVQFYSATNQLVDCQKGGTTCQIRRQEALQARHQDDIAALSSSSRQKNVSPPLMTSAGGKPQEVFVVSGVPQQCQLIPDSGSCRAFAPMWFYNVTSERCERFVYGLCGGNDNRFPTADDCYNDCKPSASPCHSSKKKCSRGQECRLTHSSKCYFGPCKLTAHCTAALGDHEMRDVHVPQCTGEGLFELKQCQREVCWCVKAKSGEFNKAVTHRASTLQCRTAGASSKNYAKIKCPEAGTSASASCADKCRDARCPGNPGARCVLDLCKCETRFVDSKGKTVKCAADKCKGNVFTKAEKNCDYKTVCGKKGPKRCEYEERCLGAVCANNPCGVCVSDACTNDVKFVDIITGSHAVATCNKVTHTSCEIRKCEVMSHNARANVSDTPMVVPECMEDGSYNPQQKRYDDSHYCVDAFGQPANASKSGECDMDPVVKVELKVVYDGDYDKVVPGNSKEIKKAFKGALVDIGIPAVMIKKVKLRAGSIVLSSEIVRHSDFPMDLAVIRPLVQFRALSGDLTLRVGSLTLKVKTDGGILANHTTASQLEGPDDSGLSGGAIAGIVIFFLLLGGGAAGGAAFYFLIYKRRLQEGDRNPYLSKDGVEGAENKKFNIFTIIAFFTKPPPPPDDFVEEPMEDHYVKERD